ncbi:MAG TPA: replicative DNA helicase, partial [Clostridiales bacterium]|nr:replicative DNA helicase [Clostridiales bacterium]
MDEALIRKILPHSTEAEQSVIGSMIMDRDAIMAATEVINGSDFYDQQYMILFDTMVELFNEGKPVDLITLQDRLKEKDVPAQVSSLEFIRDLVAAVPTSANVRYYAQIVRDKSVLRKLIKSAEETANDCYLDKENLDSIIEKAEKSVFNIVQNRGSKEFTDIKDVVLRSID